MKGKLYIVSTPIGNLEDITFRAIKVLKDVNFILAEDTKKIKKLLSYYKIQNIVYKYSEGNKLNFYLNSILNGKNAALVSGSGTPLISDPGFRIIILAIEKGIDIVPIPGASAITSALVVSGFSLHNFLFLGFLSKRQNKRRKELNSVKNLPYTLIIFESPHRIKNTLQDMLSILGNRRICIAREMTKIYEEIIRGRISEVSSYFENKTPIGEFTIVVDKA
jgi:16S rRNA (cytidine1402-2'-O)-methyltransferase